MNIFKDLTEAEKKTLTAWGIAGLVIFLAAIFIKVGIIDKQGNSDETEVKLDKDFSVVYDYSRYYTVSGTLDKFYQYMNAEDTDALMKVLDPQYIKDKKITSDNVLDFVDNSDINLSFEPRKMCKKAYAKGKVRYLYKVKEVPLFLQDGDDYTNISDSSLKDVYYQIDLDGNTLTFTIRPISEKVYGEGCNGES